MAVCVLCLLLSVSWVGLQSVTVLFPGHTHFSIQTISFRGEMLNFLIEDYTGNKPCPMWDMFLDGSNSCKELALYSIDYF